MFKITLLFDNINVIVSTFINVMLFIYFSLGIVFINQCDCAYDVDQWNAWPVPLDSLVNFTISKNYNDKSELLIKVIDENKDTLSLKSVRVSKRSYVDLSTDYFVIKKEKILYDNTKFSLTMSFYQKSFGHYLSMEWNEYGSKYGSFPLIYREKILLTKDWLIDLKVQVLEYKDREPIFVDDSRYFQAGKKVRVSCSASDGLPPAKIYVDETLTKRFRDVSYDKALNQWVGFLTLAISDHNHNVSCRVSGSSQSNSYNIIVNHPTSDLQLNPKYNGYTMNGSTLTCEPVDGYPAPIIRWDFVSVKNYSYPTLLYEIKGDKLQILSTVPMRMEMEFNCSAFYKDPLDNTITLFTKPFKFTIGEKPNNINFVLNNKELMTTPLSSEYVTLNIAAIGAGITGVVIIVIAVMIVIMLCHSKPKSSRSLSSNQPEQESSMYSGSLLAGSKSAIRNQAVKIQNGNNQTLISPKSSTAANTDHNELNYDDMPRGRRPIQVIDDPVIYSTIVGTMQPKVRPSLDLGPIDRV